MLAPPPKPPPRPRFVPDGWLWVVEAINVVGRHAHGDAWTGKERTARSLRPLPSDSDEELRLLIRAKQRTWRKGQKSKFTNVELRTEYEQERAASLRYQDAMRQLQQWLYASQVAAQVLKKSGDMTPIPQTVWGKDDAPTVLRSGKVEFSVGRAYYGGGPATIEGTVLISKDELDRALEGGSARADDAFGLRFAAVEKEGRERIEKDPTLSTNKIAKQMVSEKKSQNFGEQTTRQILDGRYPAAQSRGFKGVGTLGTSAESAN